MHVHTASIGVITDVRVWQHLFAARFINNSKLGGGRLSGEGKIEEIHLVSRLVIKPTLFAGC